MLKLFNWLWVLIFINVNNEGESIYCISYQYLNVDNYYYYHIKLFKIF